MTAASRGERGQASVELALVLPLVALVAGVVLQVALVVRDQVHLTRATSAAARAVMVDPTEATARRTVASVGEGLDIRSVSVSGPRSAGSMVTVGVTARPRSVPGLGAALRWFRLSERLVVRIEGT